MWTLFVASERSLDKSHALPGLPGWLSSKEYTCNAGDIRRPGFSPQVGEDPLEEEMETRSSTHVWESPWAEEPGALEFMGSQRVRRGWATERACSQFLICTFDTLIPIAPHVGGKQNWNTAHENSWPELALWAFDLCNTLDLVLRMATHKCLVLSLGTRTHKSCSWS